MWGLEQGLGQVLVFASQLKPVARFAALENRVPASITERSTNDFPLVMKYVNYRLFYASKVLAQYKHLFLPSFEQTIWEGKKKESEVYCCPEHYKVKVQITALCTMKKIPAINQTKPTNQAKKTPKHPSKKKPKTNPHNDNQKNYLKATF